jgi:hypothetical protein
VRAGRRAGGRPTRLAGGGAGAPGPADAPDGLVRGGADALASGGPGRRNPGVRSPRPTGSNPAASAAAEVAAAEAAGFEPVGLGERILRVETAAIVGVALVAEASGMLG